MEPLLIVGAAGLIWYNAINSEPTPKAKHDPGTSLPNPRFLYSDPANWVAAPVDISYREHSFFYGPGNDPRRRFLLPGGTRVVHSGYGPDFVRTNQVWVSAGPSAQPSSVVPMYKPAPVTGIGEPGRVTSRTVVA